MRGREAGYGAGWTNWPVRSESEVCASVVKRDPTKWAKREPSRFYYGELPEAMANEDGNDGSR